MNSSQPEFVRSGLKDAAIALDAGDPIKAVEVLKATSAGFDLLKRIEKITEEAENGSMQAAETLLDLLLGDLTEPGERFAVAPTRRIVVTVHGGAVQEVRGNIEGVEVEVIDLDLNEEAAAARNQKREREVAADTSFHQIGTVTP